MMSVPWQWGQCRTCIIMLSLGWLGGCSASHTPRENSRPTPKPRHHFVDPSADVSRLCSVIVNPAISTSRLLGCRDSCCAYSAWLLTELRFFRHSRLHSAYM